MLFWVRVLRHVCVRMLSACARILEVCIRIQLSCARMLHICARILIPRNPNPTLCASLSFISLISYASDLFLFMFVSLCFSVCFSMAFLALCYIAFFRPKVTNSFGIPPLSFAFKLECLPLPRLGDKEGVLVRSYVLHLKLEITRNISKSLDILTVSKQASFAPK